MSKATVSGGTDGLYSATIEKDDGTPEVVQAWCADLTEDLGGSVGMIEIAGGIGKGVNVQPGYDGNAVYDAARDGDMYEVPRKPGIQPASGNYWNWAMRPGWQKWRHPYRYGTVSAIDQDANTCTVTLDACLATDTPDGKQLDVNQQPTVSATFDYMSCDSVAFEDGDEVIVKFDHDGSNNWTTATVIGFKSNPKGCAVFTFVLTREDGTLITEASGLLYYIRIYNSLHVLLSTTTTWVDGKWAVALDDDDDTDPNGYYAVYDCEYSANATQYPYRYKDADKFQSEDLISEGDYVDTIPYFYFTSDTVPEIVYDNMPYYDPCTDTGFGYDSTNWPSYTKYFTPTTLLDITRSVNVISTVPYRVTESFTRINSWEWYTDGGAVICGAYQVNPSMIVTGTVLSLSGNPLSASASYDVGAGSGTHSINIVITPYNGGWVWQSETSFKRYVRATAQPILT